MKSIGVLARLTFREAIRRRIVLTGLILGILFLILFSIGSYLISTEIQRETLAEGGAAYQNVMRAEMSNFLLMAGLYAVTFLSVAMGALLGADTLAGEINSGSIQTILTKPIRRSDVVFGKWLGFAALLGMYVLLCMAVGYAAASVAALTLLGLWVGLAKRYALVLALAMSVVLYLVFVVGFKVWFPASWIAGWWT